jgi:hypothetical protein
MCPMIKNMITYFSSTALRSIGSIMLKKGYTLEDTLFGVIAVPCSLKELAIGFLFRGIQV